MISRRVLLAWSALLLPHVAAIPALEAATCANGCWSQVSSNRHAPSSVAKAGCTNMFQKTVIPCTVTSTKVQTVTATQTAAPVLTTQLTTVTVASTDVEPTTVTTVSVAVATSTKEIVQPVGQGPTLKNRELDARTVTSCTAQTTSTTVVPTYFSSCANMAQYSSACSCFSVTHSTITHATPTVHVTSVHTVTVSTTSTSVVKQTQTVTTPTTVYTPTTAVAAYTAVATEVCTYPFDSTTINTCATASNGKFSLAVTSSGYTYNTNNPGNDFPAVFPPLYSYYSGDLDPCGAVNACADVAAADPDSYYSFDLHYLCLDHQWECVQFFDPNSDPTYYNVPNADVVVAYLYDLVFS